MKWRNYGYMVVIATIGFFTMNCSNPVFVQKDDSVDMNNYHTYSWVESHADQNDNKPRATAYADISVHNAVNAELNKIGWREVPDNPDAFVSYDILVERASEQRFDPIYSQPFSRVYYNPFRKRWSSIYYPSQFIGYQDYEVPVKQGTVTVSIMDANSDKIVWQGWTTDDLNYAKITDEEISRSVRNIFNKFDVASR